MDAVNTSCWDKIKQIKVRQLIEIPIFIYFFDYTLSASVINNLIIYKLCKLKYNETICECLISSPNNQTLSLEEELQRQATPIIMCKTIIEGLFPALLSLFLGPLSDIKGRKPLILASAIGHLFYFMLTVIYIHLGDWSPWYLLIASIPLSLSGAVSSIMTSAYCYITDITNIENRSARMGILQSILLIGVFFASISSAYLLNFIGYAGVFSVCIILSIVNIFSVFIIDESIPNISYENISILFVKKVIIDAYHTFNKGREKGRKVMLWLIIMANALNILVAQGDSTVSYLFTREKLQWILKDFTLYVSYGIVMTAFGTILTTLVFQKYFHMLDISTLIMSYTSAAFKFFITFFVTKSWHMYLAATVGSFSNVSSTISKAFLTKIIDNEEIVRVISFTSCIELALPLMSAPIYTLLYNSTLLTLPGAFNLLTMSICLLNALLMGIIYFLYKKYPSDEYETIDNNYDAQSNPLTKEN